jgi:hypothetical protein
VWTPKRVLMLIGGFVLFWLAYAVYAFFLGVVDAHLELPAEYRPPTGETPPFAVGELSLRDKMLAQAFGDQCEELRRGIKLLLRDKGVVISAEQFDIDKSDGRVKFSPFSAAMFPKNKDASSSDINAVKGDAPEINTVKCDFAYLTLDKPVTMISELASRKVKKVELRGGFKEAGVTIVNNRRTRAKNDDVEVFISMSPLFYEEDRNLIWTDGIVKMQDFQSQPKPTLVTATGMDLYLTPESSPNQPKSAQAPPRPKGTKVSNVDLLVLRSSVNMHFYVDANDGFMGNNDNPDAKSPARAKVDPKAVADKSHVFITTPGSFTYDPNKEQARFDSPPMPIGGRPAGAPQQQVLVSKEHLEKKFDQLICDRLDLQFRRKAPLPNQKAAPNDPTGGNKEIETAVATVRPGGEVLLTSDTNNLEAWGDKFCYYGAEPGKGPKTELFGDANRPMHGVKDGHRIKARDLQLTGNDRFGNGQAAFSRGPGRIDLTDRDKQNPKKTFPVHILWKDTLVSTQERDGDKVFELWTITKDASYVDEDQKQELHAQKIQVWLEPNDAAHGGPRASGGPKQRVHKIEAFGNVRAAAQETIVKRADHLLIVFRPEIVAGAELPTLPEPPSPKRSLTFFGPRDSLLSLNRWLEPGALLRAATLLPEPAVAPQNRVDLGPPLTTAPVIVRGAPPLSAPPAAAPAKPAPRKPIVLDADDVALYVATLGGKKQLDKLDASGHVHVVQQAEKAGEKGLDIKGDLLNLVHDASTDLNVLTVYADTKKLALDGLARLEMNETILWGPKVTIDQIKNRADVDGLGAMSMPSKTSLDGDRPARPGARLNIHWKKNMTFDGKIAWFFGGVQGEQDDSSILCESMQAVMDRMVVFKEGHKDGEGAKVERLLCSTKVYVKDEQLDKNGKREKASILECRELQVDNLYGPTRAIGPGRFFHLAPGDDDDNQPTGTAKKGPAPAKKDKTMQLTRIDFRGWMFSNTKAGYKNAKFRDDIHVYRVPSEIFEIQIDPDKLPKDGFYLKCKTLELESKEVNKKTVQAMVATDQVYFRNQDFFGFADVMRFNEATDTIIFEAVPGNLVKIFQRTPTMKRDITGRTVLYNRKSGEFKVAVPGVINSSRLETAPDRSSAGARRRRLPGLLDQFQERSAVLEQVVANGAGPEDAHQQAIGLLPLIARQ